MPLSAEIPPSPEKRGTRGYLDQLKESMVENSKKIFDWFKTLFTKSKEKGLKETLMGSFLGFLSIFERAEKLNEDGKTEPQTPAEAPRLAETQAHLDQLAQNVGLPPLDHTKLKHWDPNIQDWKKQDPDALMGYRKMEKPNDKGEFWTLCSATALGNLKRFVKMAGGREKKVVVIDNVKDIDNLEAILRSPQTPKKFKDVDLTGMTFNDIRHIIPQGDADKVQLFYQRIDTPRYYGNPNDMVNKLNASGITICDISTTGSTAKQHRCMGFKALDGNWYIIDPYSRADHLTTPIPFLNYKTTIHFVVPIQIEKPAPMAVA